MESKNKWDFLIACVYSVTIIAVFGLTASNFDETEIRGWLAATGIAGSGHYAIRRFFG